MVTLESFYTSELQFDEMDNLKSTGLEHSWLQPLAENLQTIKVNECPCLENLEAPFSNLTRFEVSSCKRVQYMFTSSTAKGLAQLKTVKIQECKSLQEIVSTEGRFEEKILESAHGGSGFSSKGSPTTRYMGWLTTDLKLVL
ncbi:hypothetical protein Fmac_001785 [Flemingia macrophylla]|uniref:Disease resistance protein At4g27190-like leucine-rich repeats domain-containing protein n=1 Tax=Flemingia macrophylla TaxID=520843 RepID=A0ABD1NI38_9FABA